MTENTCKNKIIYDLGEELAAQVVGAASTLLADLIDIPENYLLRKMTGSECIVFLDAFLTRLNCVYTMQIRAITDKIEYNIKKSEMH
jgi:hypothetical protein